MTREYHNHQLFSANIPKYYAFVFFREFFFFSAVLVPFFTDWAGLSLFQMTLLQSWFAGWIFLLEVPTGAIADRFGRKSSLILSGLVVAIAALIYGSIPSFPVFLLAEFLFAVSFALLSGADEAFLFDSLKLLGKEKKAKHFFGKAESFRFTGIMIAAPIGSIVATHTERKY